MLSKYKGKLYCFSPPVMLATFLIEFGLAVHTYLRYRASTVKKLAIAMLVALGSFQLAEYMVCGGLGISGIDWARFGYVSITLLPPLGVHMVTALAGKKIPALTNTAYGTCAAFIAFFVLGQGALSGHECYSNYAVFHVMPASSILYGLYYYGWMLIGTYLAYVWSSEQPKRRVALQAMVMGYAAFILPTTAFNIIDPTTVKGIPSIMCGFAVIYAIVLAVKVLPNSCKPHNAIDKVLGKIGIKL